MKNMFAILMLVTMAALAVNHVTQASCLHGNVVIEEGEKLIDGCYKYTCTNSEIKKINMTPIFCGFQDDVCCKKYTQDFIPKTVVRRGCECKIIGCTEIEVAWYNRWNRWMYSWPWSAAEMKCLLDG